MKTTTRILAFLAAALLGGTLAAQPRVFPEKSKVGWLEIAIFPQASIDGNPLRFGAGGRIHDQSNRIVMPASLSGGALVRYELDPSGHIQRAWILTEAEVAAARR